MSSDPMSPHATQLRNHWYWRPGWNPNRRFYTWHLTFEGQDELHRLVSTYQDALRDVPGLDLIPLRWLHLTTQGVGSTDEVQPDQARAIAIAVGRRLGEIPPTKLTFHRPVIRTEALALRPAPTQALVIIRDVIRDGIATVWGEDGVPETGNRFDPHLSLAYANTDAPTDTAFHALSSVSPEPVHVTIKEASLIVLCRDDHLYRWDTFVTASLRANSSLDRG
jgi:hypothetical protein